VIVVSPLDGEGDIRVSFTGGRAFREARRLGRDADRIVIHFQPALYYRRGAAAALSKIRTSLSLLSLVRTREGVEILVHEATPSPPRWRPDHLLIGLAFARAQLIFHTDTERRALERDYGIRVDARLVDHSEGVSTHRPLSKDEARRRLGLDVDPRRLLLVCAGFLHPWKGYERAVRAFAEAGSPGQLMIVGSVREPSPANLAYAADLRRMVMQTEGVSLVEGFQKDEDFDRWIIAADRLLLPYRRAWSSGALARAKVLGTPAIVSAVGGLVEQAGTHDAVFDSDDGLVRLLRELEHAAEAEPSEQRVDGARKRL
jgi:glycosyltransferase involved in cell wall biosynthesis